MPAWALKGAGGSGTADWFLNQLAVARATLPDSGFDTIIGSDLGETITTELVDVVGVADATPSDNDTGGVVTIDVGDAAVAPCSARLALTGAGSHVKQMSVGGAWFMASLVKITQPLDSPDVADTRADAVCLFGDADNQISLGIFGNFSGGSLTNWIGVANQAGTRHTSIGPALDAEESPVWHLFQAWIDPDGDLHFAIDSQEFNSTIDAADVPTLAAMLSILASRTATGDHALINVDKFAVFVKSPTVGEP